MTCPACHFRDTMYKTLETRAVAQREDAGPPSPGKRRRDVAGATGAAFAIGFWTAMSNDLRTGDWCTEHFDLPANKLPRAGS